MNQVSISGRITKDTEVQHLNNGTPLLSFSIAQNIVNVNKQNNTKIERAMFFDVNLFGNYAQSIQFIEKGSLIFVSGSLREESYTDKEGKHRSRVSINAKTLYIVPPNKNKENQNKNVNHQNQAQNNYAQQPQPQPQQYNVNHQSGYNNNQNYQKQEVNSNPQATNTMNGEYEENSHF